MPSIPVDVLREILEHVHYADLPTLCRVNKVFCSCSQDILYRSMHGDKRVF
jgi:F-box domain